EQLAALADEWNAKQRACLKLQLLIDAAVDLSLLSGHVCVHSPRLAGVDDLADDAGVVGDAQLASLDAERRPSDERARGTVPEKDAGALGAEQPRCGLRELRQKLVHLQCARPAGSDF